MSDDGIQYPVVIVSIDVPQPDPDNPVDHNERNVRTIMDSFRDFGQDQSLVLQEGTHRIIKGHGRLEAGKRLGWTQIEVRYVPDDDPKAIERGLADNRSRDHARWNPEKLRLAAGRTDLSKYWRPDELAQYQITMPEVPAAMRPGDGDPIGTPQPLPPTNDGAGSVLSGKEPGPTRDERQYSITFLIGFDASVVVDRAIKEAETQGYSKAEWLMYMASIFLRGWDQFVRLEDGQPETADSLQE